MRKLLLPIAIMASILIFLITFMLEPQRLPGRKHASGGRIISGVNGDDLYTFPDDSPKMNAAIKQAKESLPSFFAAFSAPKANQRSFKLKVPLKSDGRAEYVWIDNIFKDYDGSICGRVANIPQWNIAVSFGDMLSSPYTDIVDWVYIEDGVLIGGYTLRVMFEAASPEERKELQEKGGFRILPNTKGPTSR